MTIKECIDLVDNVKPNQYGIEDKVEWLSYLDGTIINDVLKTHEGYDGRYDEFVGYSADRLSERLVVQSPYDRLYTAYLKMKIDEENGETARYNNSATMFNSYMLEYKKYYNKIHMPLHNIGCRKPAPVSKFPSNVTDAQIENLKRELLTQLREDISKAVSEDRIYDVVMKFVSIHREEFKGKDGADGKNGLNGKDGEKGAKGANGKDGKDGVDGKSAYQYAKEAGYTGTEEEFAVDLKQESPTIEQFNKIVNDIADLKYIPIDITNMTNNVATVEMGTVVNGITISWTLNKEALRQTLDGDELAITARSKLLNNLAINTNKTFTLVVTDERTTDSANTSINFLNGVYYGVIENGAVVDSAAILALTRKLQGSKGITFTANAKSTQKIAYAIPTRYGTPNFNVGGFDGGFTLEKTFDFTNASGYTESYNVWLSDNVGLGDTTVKVS